LRTTLRTEHNVRFALLFGSAATGADTLTSDIDVLVVLRDPSLERVVDLSGKLATTVGRPCDIVRLDDAEGEPLFLADAVADGRVLVDREGLWPRLRGREISLRQRGSRQEAGRAQAVLAGIDWLLAN